MSWILGLHAEVLRDRVQHLDVIAGGVGGLAHVEGRVRGVDPDQHRALGEQAEVVSACGGGRVTAFVVVAAAGGPSPVASSATESDHHPQPGSLITSSNSCLRVSAPANPVGASGRGKIHRALAAGASRRLPSPIAAHSRDTIAIESRRGAVRPVDVS